MNNWALMDLVAEGVRTTQMVKKNFKHDLLWVIIYGGLNLN